VCVRDLTQDAWFASEERASNAQVRMTARRKLLRILGLGFGLAAVVGSMVGQGILRTPGIVAGAVDAPGIILGLWFLGAVFAAISSLAFMELGTSVPCAGGPYDYVRRAFGPLAGVVVGWASWLVLITGQAMLATVVGEFLQRLGVLVAVPTSCIAVAVLALFWAVNWTGTRISGASQVLFSALKGAALIALIVFLLAHPGEGRSAPVEIDTLGLLGITVALRVIVSTYNGWQDIAYYCEELEQPERTLPRAMISGIVTVAVLYLLINFALLHVLSPADMAQSNLPAADAAAVVFGSMGEFALTLFGVLSVGAITNLKMMGSARLAYALARGGSLPSVMTQVAESGTPRVALTVTTLIAAAFAATGTYTTIIATQIALTVFSLAAANLAAIGLRRREPDLARPFRMPLYPVPVLLALAINLALLTAFVLEDPLHSLQGLVILAAIALIYSVLHRRRAQHEGETPAAAS
jgi:APA family basic amino acid/polyamine antiporter